MSQVLVSGKVHMKQIKPSAVRYTESQLSTPEHQLCIYLPGLMGRKHWTF